MLDAAQYKKETNANALEIKVKNPTFPDGIFIEKKDEDGNVIECVTYADLRWQNFVRFPTEKMFHIVKDYLQKHSGELESVKKIKNLDKLNMKDFNELQMILETLKTPKTNIAEEFKSIQELIIFIRKIVGLDKKAIDKKCAKFLNINEFNKEQQQLINLIIDFAIRNGNVTKDDLVNAEPFSEIEISKLFENKLTPILQLVEIFTDSLSVVA